MNELSLFIIIFEIWQGKFIYHGCYDPRKYGRADQPIDQNKAKALSAG